MDNGLTTGAFGNDEELSEMALRNADNMAFPPTELEATTFAEVMALPRVVVTRPPREKLLAAGMVPYDCHVNCSEQARQDPVSLHVTGWLVYGDDLILHSVINRAGQWICLTPQLVPAPQNFAFIPDPYLEWLDNGQQNIPFRHGLATVEVLRKDPERHILMRDEFHALISSGMSVLQARAEIDVKFGGSLK
jgi:hypothetical protein